MKFQDVGFLIVFIVLLYFRNPKWFTAAGLALLIFAMPLFYFWVFFTAQRFIMYAAAFFLLAALIQLYNLRSKK